MPVMTMIQAINDALRVEMRSDDRVVVLGEDVGKRGGVFLATEGLYGEFGPERVIDTPLAESALVGAAAGMAMYGLRPVAEIQFTDFIHGALDQIFSVISKLRYRSGGQFSAPMVVRSPCSGGIKGGMHHSQSLETLFVHTAGLKVVMPSRPYDAKGLLVASIKDPDPVIYFEPKRIYRTTREEVPEGEYTVPIGEGKIVREGTDVSLITYGAMVHQAMEAAETVAKDGISCEVVDLRSLLPFDGDLILKTVKKTGRPVIVHEAPRLCGFGAEIAAFIAERALLHLQAPVLRVTGYDTPFPLVHEHLYLPEGKRLVDAIKKSATF